MKTLATDFVTRLEDGHRERIVGLDWKDCRSSYKEDSSQG